MGKGFFGKHTEETKRKISATKKAQHIVPSSVFKKGHIPWHKGKKGLVVAWNKGKTLSEEHRKHLSESHKGYKMPEEQKRKIRLALKGRKLSPEHIERQADSHRGTKHPPHTEETRKKMSESHKGEKSYLWRGGISRINRTERENIMSSVDYKIWRDSVFKRDDYRCFDCGEKGGKLQAHHIYAFAKFPRLRLAVENGITLCVECHKAHTFK